jgi:hypothetical protein
VEPDSGSLVDLLLRYYTEGGLGERRCAKEGFVHRPLGHAPDVTDVLADVLFAAPELGTVATEKRGALLVLRTCDRTVGIPMTDGPRGRIVRLQSIFHAVNASLVRSAERRRFLPLRPAQDTAAYALVDLEGGALLHAMGLLAATPGELSRFALWQPQSVRPRFRPAAFGPGAAIPIAG